MKYLPERNNEMTDTTEAEMVAKTARFGFEIPPVGSVIHEVAGIEALPYGSAVAGFCGSELGVKTDGAGGRTFLLFYPGIDTAYPLEVNYPHGLTVIYIPEESRS